MLGKRFCRTTSMSHLGPGCEPASSDESDTKVEGMQEYNTVCCVSHKAVITQEGGCHDANSGGYADMVLDFDPPYKFSDIIFSESPTHEEQDHEQIPSPFQLQAPSLVPYQMGLWTQQHMGFVPQMGPGKLHHMCVEASISPVDFLDVCFYCKRRLRHERDIFIYRGDSAFCSEECRHRHISRDERRSLRGANKRGGARASSSETAVAA